MALKGNLRRLTSSQLLNLIDLAHKTGVLTIYEGVPNGEVDAMGEEVYTPGMEFARLYFREGRLIYASARNQEGKLTSVLHRRGKLNQRQAQFIEERTHHTTDKALALLLLQTNYVTQSEIVFSLQEHILEIISGLMNWSDGLFSYEDREVVLEDRILVPVAVKDAIIECNRRQRRQQRLEAELPDLSVVLQLPEDSRRRFRRVHLSIEEWRVIAEIDGKNSVRDIARMLQMNDATIREIVYNLADAGLILVTKTRRRRTSFLPSLVDREGTDERAALPMTGALGSLVDRVRGAASRGDESGSLPAAAQTV